MIRNFGLDTARAVAILLVLVAHLSAWAVDDLALNAEWLHRLGWLTQITGTLGVELFFVLSGFLIGALALTRQHSLLHFYTRRWLRTLPAYFFVLIVLLILKPVPGDWWRYFLFTQPTINDFFSVSWSLSIEEWFYLLLPLFLCIPRRYFLHSVLVTLLLLGLARYASGMDYEPMHRAVALRMDALLAGVALAWIKLEHRLLYTRLSQRCVIIPITIILAGLYVSGLMHVSGVYLPWFYTPLARSLFFTLLPIVLALLLPAAENLPVLPFKTFLTTLSIGSYSLYLLHEEIFLLLRQTFLKNMIIGLPVGVVLASAAAFVLYQCVEKPFMKYRDKTWSSRN